ESQETLDQILHYNSNLNSNLNSDLNLKITFSENIKLYSLPKTLSSEKCFNKLLQLCKLLYDTYCFYDVKIITPYNSCADKINNKIKNLKNIDSSKLSEGDLIM